jgi:hypothetical protein
MGANRQTLCLRFVIKTMSAAVAHMPNNFLGLSTSFDRDHLNTHRHCLLAFKAPDNLGEIDHFCDIGIFSRYFSKVRAWLTSTRTRFTTMAHASHLRVVAGRTDAVPAGR